MLLRAAPVTLIIFAATRCLAQDDNSCSLCFGGADFNATITIGGPAGLSCSQIAEDIADYNQEQCEANQVTLGFENCGCNTYPPSYCPMCEGAFIDIPNRDSIIPGTDDRCSDRLFVLKDSEDDDCEQARKPGYFCGCPGVLEPPCSICGEIGLEISLPETTIMVDWVVGDFTCEEYSNQALRGELNETQCALVQAEALANCGCLDPSKPSSSTPVPTTTDNNMPEPTESPMDPTPGPTTTDDSAAAYRGGCLAATLGILVASIYYIR